MVLNSVLGGLFSRLRNTNAPPLNTTESTYINHTFTFNTKFNICQLLSLELFAKCSTILPSTTQLQLCRAKYETSSMLVAPPRNSNVLQRVDITSNAAQNTADVSLTGTETRSPPPQPTVAPTITKFQHPTNSLLRNSFPLQHHMRRPFYAMDNTSGEDFSKEEALMRLKAMSRIYSISARQKSSITSSNQEFFSNQSSFVEILCSDDYCSSQSATGPSPSSHDEPHFWTAEELDKFLIDEAKKTKNPSTSRADRENALINHTTNTIWDPVDNTGGTDWPFIPFSPNNASPSSHNSHPDIERPAYNPFASQQQSFDSSPSPSLKNAVLQADSPEYRDSQHHATDSPLRYPSTPSEKQAMKERLLQELTHFNQHLPNRTVARHDQFLNEANIEFKKVQLYQYFNYVLGDRFSLCNPYFTYHRNEVVGSGASGDVVAAHRQGQDSFTYPMVIKTCALLTGRERKFEATYIRREVEIMNLKHRNIMGLKEAFAYKEDIYIVMPRMACSLNDIALGPLQHYYLDEGLGTYCFHELSKGLAFLHSAGYFHGDIKPDNVLVNYRGEVKLTDFGFAGIVGLPDVLRRGSNKYIAPEVANVNTTFDETSDMWSLGIMMLELLDGGAPDLVPYYDDSVDTEELFAAYAQRDVPTPRSSHLSIYYHYIISSLLIINPSNRMSARQLQKYFENLIIRRNIRYADQQQFSQFLRSLHINKLQ